MKTLGRAGVRSLIAREWQELTANIGAIFSTAYGHSEEGTGANHTHF